MTDRVIRAAAALLGATLIVAPATAVLARFTGTPSLALIAGIIVLCSSAILLGPYVPREVVEFARERPPLAAAWLAVAIAAATQLIRLSVFAYDSVLVGWSALPSNGFIRTHFCFSGYYEGERLARAGNVNIYDPLGYVSPGCEDLTTCPERAIGNLKVDLYQYPPSFLVIPAVLLVLSRDFFDVRALWFLVQVAALIAGLLCAARWIGGSAGRRAAALTPLLFVALPTLTGLQFGKSRRRPSASACWRWWRSAPVAPRSGGCCSGW